MVYWSALFWVSEGNNSPIFHNQLDGLVQDCSKSIANALGLLQSLLRNSQQDDLETYLCLHTTKQMR